MLDLCAGLRQLRHGRWGVAMAGHTERLSVVVHPGMVQPGKSTVALHSIHGDIVGYALHREMPDGASIGSKRAASITLTEARRNAILWAHADELAKALQRCIAAMEEHDAENYSECDTEFDSIIAEAQTALRNAGV